MFFLNVESHVITYKKKKNSYTSLLLACFRLLNNDGYFSVSRFEEFLL